jgi:hypothetical protein
MSADRESFANPQAQRASVINFRAGASQFGQPVTDSSFEGRRLA